MRKLREKRAKTGGRKKGTPNKRTMMLQDLLDKNDLDPIRGIIESLQDLDGISAFSNSEKITIAKEKASIYLELLQYLYPKRKAIELGEETRDLINEVYDLSHADEDNQDQASGSDEASD